MDGVTFIQNLTSLAVVSIVFGNVDTICAVGMTSKYTFLFSFDVFMEQPVL